MACGSLVPYQARQRWEILLWHDRGSNHRRIQKLTGERDIAGAEPTDQHELAFLQPRIALETQRGEKKLRESGLLPARRALGSSLTPASSVTLDSVSRRDCWTAARRARRPHLLQRGGARRGWPRRGPTALQRQCGGGGWVAGAMEESRAELRGAVEEGGCRHARGRTRRVDAVSPAPGFHRSECLAGGGSRQEEHYPAARCAATLGHSSSLLEKRNETEPVHGTLL
jgi:hypothetical protein